MAVNLSFIGGAGWQFFNNDGSLLSGGKIYTYVAGTTTPQTTYTSRSGTVANTNPIILDSVGRTPEQIWSTEGSLYKYVVTTPDNIQIRTWDNIGGSVVASDLAQDLAASSGSSLVGYLPAGTGAVATTVQSKLRESVSVKDFGAIGNGIADDTAAIQAAINSLSVYSGRVYFPAGTYLVSSSINIFENNIYLEGCSVSSVTIKASAVIGNVISIYDGIPSALVTGVGISNLKIDGNNLANYGIYSFVTESWDLFNNVQVTKCLLSGVFHSGWSCRAQGLNVLFNTVIGVTLNQECNNCIFDIEAQHNGGAGIVVYGGDSLTITGASENNAGHGIYLYSSQSPNIGSININNVYLENNGSGNSAFAGISISGSGPSNIAQNITIDNAFLGLAGENGIRVGPNVVGVQINGVVFRNTGLGSPLVFGSEYLNQAYLENANVVVSKDSALTVSNYSIETSTLSQRTLLGVFIFDDLISLPNQSFAPTVITGGSTGRTYSVQTGRFTRLSDKVLFSLQVVISAVGSSIGPLDITLPYISKDTSFVPCSVSIELVSYSNTVVGLVLPGTNTIRLYEQSSNIALSPLNNSVLQVNSAFYISGFYSIV